MSSSKRVQYKYIFAVVILFLVLTLAYLLNSRYGATDHRDELNHLEAQKASIADVFLHKEEITLTGDSLNPVFTIWDPLVLDSIIVLSDFVGNRILFFNKNNRLIRSVGRRGTGPSEFQLPYGVVVDRNQHYYVNDRGNMRVQIFDRNYELIKTFTTPGQNETILLRKNTPVPNIILIGASSCQKGLCLIREFDPEGNTVRDFAYYTGDFHLYTWTATIDSEGKIYLINILSNVIDVYDSRGRHVNKISLNSPSMTTLFIPDDASFTDIGEYLKKPHTRVVNLKVISEYLLVCIESQHPKAYTIDIYSTNGKLLYYGIEIPGMIARSKNDTIYFYQKDESQYGKIDFGGYHLNIK